MGKRLLAILLGILNAVSSEIVNDTNVVDVNGVNSTVDTGLLYSSNTVVNSSVNDNSTTMVDVSSVNSTVDTNLLSSVNVSIGSSSGQLPGVGTQVFYYIWASFLLFLAVALWFFGGRELVQDINRLIEDINHENNVGIGSNDNDNDSAYNSTLHLNQENNRMWNGSDGSDSLYCSMLGLDYDNVSSRDSLSSGNNNADPLGNDDRNNNVNDEDNICVVCRSPDHGSTVSLGSFASFRYSSGSESENSNQEIDQSEDSNKNDGLHDRVGENDKGSMKLQDVCSVRSVGSDIAETVL